VFLKCAEILPARLWDNVEEKSNLKKIVAQKINIILLKIIIKNALFK
jgi:hypothetical protein